MDGNKCGNIKKERSLFGKRLYELRIESNMTQREMADKLEISTQTLSNYENEKSEPDIKTLCDIADKLGVSLDYLCGRVSEKEAGYVQIDPALISNIVDMVWQALTSIISRQISGKTIPRELLSEVNKYLYGNDRTFSG